MEKLTSSTLHALRATSTKRWIKHDHFALTQKHFPPSQIWEEWIGLFPGVLLVLLKSSRGCLALVGCTIVPMVQGPARWHQGAKRQPARSSTLPTRQGFFFFFKVPLLFIEISQSYYYWHHSATADVFGAWGGGAVREHTLTETNLWKMYLIHTNSPGKKKKFLSRDSPQDVAKPLQPSSTTPPLSAEIPGLAR